MFYLFLLKDGAIFLRIKKKTAIARLKHGSINHVTVQKETIHDAPRRGKQIVSIESYSFEKRGERWRIGDQFEAVTRCNMRSIVKQL